MLKLKKHIVITQRYAATTSELSKWILQLMIQKGFSFIWKPYMKKQVLLPSNLKLQNNKKNK